MEREATTGTLHDDGRTQAAKDARLVVFGWIQTGNHNVVWVMERSTTCRTRSVCVGRPGEPGGIGTLRAEDMTE
jgi:hypothetical protein